MNELNKSSRVVAAYAFEALRRLIEERTKSMLTEDLVGDMDINLIEKDDPFLATYEWFMKETTNFTNVFKEVIELMFEEQFKKLGVPEGWRVAETSAKH